jgi:hypothetical protein
MSGLFALMVLTTVLFRADDINQAYAYMMNIFSPSLFTIPALKELKFMPVIFIFLTFEWFTRHKKHALEMEHAPLYLKWSMYLLIGFVVFLAYDDNPVDFIYLQF